MDEGSKTASIQKRIQVLAALSLVEGAIAFLWLLSFPTNRQTFSLSRIAGLAGILLIFFVSAAVLVSVQRWGKNPVKLIGRITGFKYRILLSFGLITTSLLLWIGILFKDQWLLFVQESTYIRLMPILAYAILVLAQTGIFLLLFNVHGIHDANELNFIWKPALALWVVFLAIWLFISYSNLGFTSDEVGLSWGPPGTPITFAQIQLVLTISFLLLGGWQIVKPSLHKILFSLFFMRDIIVFIGLWGMAVMIWSNQPMSPTHFSPPPMPPNNEYYPNSDALVFDRSSYHLLNGTGFADKLIRRPLYVGMLTLFHKIAGGNYESTVLLQILVLAFIPPLVYLLTSTLSNRMAGLVAGGLILIRERNSIELSGKILTSNAKLMMSDMISMLGIILIMYTTVKFLLKRDGSRWEPVIVGGFLGLAALIRAQVIILVPVLVLFILLSRKPLKHAFQASILVVVGLVLVMSPWVWRNWQLTGTLILDDHGEERLLARNYSLTPYSLPSAQEGETEKEFSARLKGEILSFIQTHPANVMFFVSNHFFHNMAVSSVYIAPTYSSDSPLETVNKLAFWDDWAGNLTTDSRIPLFVNLSIVALGIGMAMAKNKFAGLLPFVAFLLYAFGNALVRSSGWRFIQPVDWIILMYYSVTLAYLPSRITSLIPQAIPDQSNARRMLTWNVPALQPFIFIILLLLGASVPVAERLVPPGNYDVFTERAKDYLSKQYGSPAEIDSFLKNQNAVLVSGIALYPRYVQEDARFYPVDVKYEYLHLWLINNEDNQIVLPLHGSPENIPHTATISVFGCREKDYIFALVVIIHEPMRQMLIRAPQVPLRCPLTEDQN